MMQRIFVQVVGFTGAERHALNTVFRLSQDSHVAREWSYEPWTANSPGAPRLALIDGSSPDASEASEELQSLEGVGIIWVGSISPAKAWRSFQRPLSWLNIVASMDEYFTPDVHGLDLDLDFGHDTWPSVLESTGAHMFLEPGQRRVLLADADSDSRLYLRTKLASFGITHIDEAENVGEAVDYLSPERKLRASYDAILVDLDLPGGDPWSVFAAPGSPRLKLLMQHGISFATRMNAKMKDCTAMGKPLDPSRLNEFLSKI